MINWIKSLFFRIKFGARSSKWSTFKKWYEETHRKECAVCGNKKCSLHHIAPFHIDPSKELDSQNVIWLCDWRGNNCHFTFGHLCDFSAYNPVVEADAAIFNSKIKERKYD